MCELYRCGQTLAQIGSQYGLTRERVRQLISRHGLNRDRGGATIRAIAVARQRSADRREREEQRYQRWLECSKESFHDLTGMYWHWGAKEGVKNPGVAFLQQKRNAIKRGIEWHMTFPEWWRVWRESGKWELRGRGTGYCMAREGDSGPYAPGNVYICTVGQNFSDSYLIHPWHERFANTNFNRGRTADRDELGLTRFERQIYDLRIAGHTRGAIAKATGRSIGTVNWHVTDIVRRFDLPRFINRRTGA